uniref:glucose-6-phosphate 1-epimerase n=1 Tax=Rhipicephalus appendiculatus TaxID=34631 RepID=A0A131YZS2_RHIAP
MNKAEEKDLIRLKTAEATACVHLYGATLISWVFKGKERIFVSEKAIFDNKKAIRGGIPFVFPNFGPWSLGPQHGFARISRWTVHEQPHAVADGGSAVTLALEDTEETRRMWNFKFRVLYTVILRKNNLVLDVDVINTGDTEFSFTILLHTYLRLNDVNQFSISGLRGSPYVDKVKQGEKSVECEDEVHIKGATDRVYSKTSDTHICSMAGKASVIVKKTKNFPDTVVWNPWVSGAASMADFGDDEYLKMVCIEPGYVSEPRKVPPNQTFQASVTMEAVE